MRHFGIKVPEEPAFSIFTDYRQSNGRAMVQAAFSPQWTKLHWDRFFSECFGSPLSISFHQCSSSSICCSYQKGKRAKPGNLPKSNAVSEFEGGRGIGYKSTFTAVCQLVNGTAPGQPPVHRPWEWRHKSNFQMLSWALGGVRHQDCTTVSRNVSLPFDSPTNHNISPKNCFHDYPYDSPNKHPLCPTQHSPTVLSSGNQSVAYEVRMRGMFLLRGTNTSLEGIYMMRNLHHPHIFRMIKPRNMRYTRHVEPTEKIKYVQFDRKTLNELRFIFLEPHFPAELKKLSCSPKCQRLILESTQPLIQ
jgi:hypothetical protein